MQMDAPGGTGWPATASDILCKKSLSSSQSKILIFMRVSLSLFRRSRRPSLPFNIRLILPKVKYFLEITLIVYYYTVFTPFGKLNHLKLNYPKKKIH